jgi:hypothetical protein
MRPIAVALVAAAWCGLADPAAATFPGREGRIAALYVMPDVRACAAQGEELCYRSKWSHVTLFLDGKRDATFARCKDPGCALSRASWSPDGRRLAWSANNSIFTALASDPRPRQFQFSGIDPAWAPGGRWLVFTDVPGVMRARGSGRAVLVAKEGYVATTCADGTIVYAGNDGELYTIRPDGSRRHKLTTGANVVTPPDCSPGSRWLLYESDDGSHRISIDGRHQRTVRTRPRGSTPVWSPSGRHIVWSDHHDIWIARPDGSHARLITRQAHQGDYQYPAWQPLPER